jgi:branched-chain amino acid transport system permease protein
MEITLPVLGQMLLIGGLIGSIYGAVAMGFSLIFGVARIVNFAHAGFVVWAMYAVFAAVSNNLMGPYWAGLVALPVFFVLGYLLQKTVMARVSEMTEEMHIIFTFGLLIVLSNIAQFFFGTDVRFLPSSGRAVEFGGVVLQREILVGGGLAVASAWGLHLFLTRTWTGKAIRASSDNRLGAALIGLRVRDLAKIAMALSLALAALAGTMLITFTTLYPLRSFELAILAFIVVVLGGMQNVLASFFAGVVLGILEGFGTLFFSPSLAQLLIYILIFAILLVRPQGLFNRSVET